MTDEILDFLEQLVKIRSVKAAPLQGMPYGENSAEVLTVFLKKAHDMGFKTKNFDNYVGTVESGEGEPKLGILCHLDVVPEGEGWSYPPYELTNKDGTLYGRGTFDDKGPAVAALFALYEAKKHGLKLCPTGRLRFAVCVVKTSKIVMDTNYALTRECRCAIILS